MGYYWEFNDDDAYQVTAGLGGLYYDEIIENPDHLGGFNVKFGINGSVACYHVHFKAGSRKVNAVRYNHWFPVN